MGGGPVWPDAGDMEDHRERGPLAPATIALAAFAAATTTALLLALAAPALAHRGHAHLLGKRAAERAVGESAQPAGDGLYRLRAGGETLLTHGPDPMPPSERIATRGADAPLGPGGPERAPVCADDYHQHVLVAHLAAAPDRLGELAGSVRAQIRRMNWVLNADAVESGGVSADYKVACDGAGEIRVDSFASPSASFEDVVAAARAAGFDRPNADYTIFFDGLGPGGGCGIGSYRPDERLVAENRSNTGGGYGITYQPCWFGTTPMHENGHNQGAVQYSSPHSTGTGGHCDQGHDVLCYAPDGGDRNQTTFSIACSDRVHFDCGGDDYFDPAPEPGEYLESRWNLGSPLNRFIAFGGAPPPPEPAAPDAPACGEPACADRLRLGSRVRGVVGGEGEATLYKLRVRRGTRRLAIAARSAAPVGLEVWRGSLPGPRGSKCSSARSGTRQRCRISRPRPGRWFVRVAERGAAEPVEFDLRTTAARGARRR